MNATVRSSKHLQNKFSFQQRHDWLFLRCLASRIRASPTNHPTYSTGVPNTAKPPTTTKLKPGPDLNHFLVSSQLNRKNRIKIWPEPAHYIDPQTLRGDGLYVYLDVYGCQMNVSDTELVLSILTDSGYTRTDVPTKADVWLIVTCSIREGAETKIWKKLEFLKKSRQRRKNTPPAGQFKPSMIVGVLGCMAERLKTGLLEKEGLVHVVAGPDSYRDLPRLLVTPRQTGQAAINVLLSIEETYADITPTRLSGDSVSAFVSIQRGCDNMCSYCIVPYTRGRERSRPIQTIVDEVRRLSDAGVKEVTLLGQNVNSYRDARKESLTLFPKSKEDTSTASGFSTVYKSKQGGLRFSDLLDQVSQVNPEMRVRFTSPHPKDFPDEVLELIASRHNICRSLHLPAQSGSSSVLESMNRGYTREAYLDLVGHVKRILPGVALTSDFITGFCGETEEQFEETVELVRKVDYNKCFIYPYSLREKSGADRHLKDDVPNDIKSWRHLELVSVYREGVDLLNKSCIGSEQLVLVTGDSKRSSQDLQGLADSGTKVIFPKVKTDAVMEGGQREPVKGDYVVVNVTQASSEVLKGVALRISSLQNEESIKFVT